MKLIKKPSAKTFWNGEECACTKVKVIVGPAMKSTWWCASIEGEERNAVRIVYGDYVFYIDNETGKGWEKVTRGKGSPSWGHRSLPVKKEISDG